MESNQFQESRDTFKVKFEGNNSIDAELFTRTINNTVELVKASAQTLDPNIFLRLEIKATKEGSFETIIDAVVKYSLNLINKDNTKVACEVIGGFLGLLKIKSHLKGCKPKAIEPKQNNSIIRNQEDQEITMPKNIVNCYFNDSKIDNSMIQIFTDLKSSGRSGLTIEHRNEVSSFKESDYEKMSMNIVEKDKPITATQTFQTIKQCELTIKKPDLVGNSKWEVIFNQVINVKIIDEEFLSKFKDGKINITAGCRLVCDLEIRQEVDSDYNILSAEYSINKVYDIKHKEDQLDLFTDYN